MTKPPRFRANITTRYGAAEKATYDAVMKLMREKRVSRSRAQLILVRQGLKYLNHTHGTR